jgi:hypothetical protein
VRGRMTAAASDRMCAEMTGLTKVVTEIVAAGPTPAPAMAATMRYRTVSAGLTFGR